MKSKLPGFIVGLLLVSTVSFGQVTIDNTFTVKQLIEDYLIGDDVEVQNITINGQPESTVNNQAGLFSGTSDFIDFNLGLVMVTGNAKTIANDCCTAAASFTSGIKTICQGEEIELQVNLSGGVDGQYTFVYTNGTNTYSVANASNGYTLTVSPNTTTTYSLTSVNNGSCNGNVSGSVTIAVTTPNDAGADIAQNYCADGSKLILTPETGQPTNGYFTPAAITLDTANSGTYNYIVADGRCAPDTAVYTLNIDEKFAVSAVALCDTSLVEYTVEITIAGGVKPYFIDGVEIADSTFTSPAIPTETNYAFVIDDSGTCESMVISGTSPNCYCEISAEIVTSDQTICIGSEATFEVNLAGGIAGQYTFEYWDGTSSITILDADTVALITVSPTSTTTYTLLSVAEGDSTTCVTGSVTITVEELPNAGDDVALAYCSSGSTLVLMPGSGQPAGGDFNIPNITLDPASSGEYIYTVQGNICPNADQAVYTLQIDEPLAANAVATCEPNYTQYTVDIAITGGTPPYTVNGTEISGSTFTSNTMAVGANFNFVINDAGGCTGLTVSGNLPQQFSYPPPTNPVSNDPDLMAIAGQDIYDAIIIEFEFLATSDSIKFNYVFASNEYPNYTCSSFNDAFGFFLSGPGISGPYSNNAKNIALIPGTQVPVAINTVNAGVPSGTYPASNCENANPDWIEHSQYFVANPNSPYNDVQFPGMTQTFTALSDVQCGEWYRIKLAIGDASDGALDSGVFLEAGSFEAFGAVTLHVEPQIGGSAVANPAYDSVLVAGCSEIYIELVRPAGVVTDSIWVEFGGTAIQQDPVNPIPGADYTLADTDTLFFFPEGIDTIGFSIATLWDGIPDEGEFIVITIHYQNGCGDWQADSATIQMVDPYILDSQGMEVTLTCPADQVLVSAIGLDGIEPYTYDWGDFGYGPDLNEVLVDVPEDSVYYHVSISDVCAFEHKLDSVLVINNIPDPLQAIIDAFQDPECPNEPVDLHASIQDGNGDYTIIWEDEKGGTYMPQEDITVSEINKTVIFAPEPLGFTEVLPVYLTVIDTCGTVIRDTVLVNYPFIQPLQANFNLLNDHCPTQPVELRAKIENGQNDFVYGWAISGGEYGTGADPTADHVHVIPAPGMNEYTLTVSDYCGRMGTDYQYIVGEGDLVRSGYAVYKDSLRVIDLDNIMNVITPNGDNKNDYFVVEGIQEFEDARLEVYDRWGKMIYENDNYNAGMANLKPDNVFDADGFGDGTYFYIVNVKSGQCVQSGTIEVLRKNHE